MIGLGSNRLTVCRRGGMSVTQAGRGGMEWLAGGRRPRWSGPYSAQATAALKAQFPTQWPTIRDYGFAHPEIVPYVNAYVPDYTDFIYVLIPTLGYTLRISRSGGAYIDSGINPQVSPRCVADMIMNNHDDTDYWGNNSISNSTYFTNFAGGALAYYRYGSIGGANAGGYTAVGTRHTWDVGKKVHVDGTLTYTSPNTYAYNSGQINILIFRCGRSNGADFTLYSFTIYDGDTKVREMYPYIKDGVSGMLDLVTGTFFDNKNGSGSFTISKVASS